MKKYIFKGKMEEKYTLIPNFMIRYNPEKISSDAMYVLHYIMQLPTTYEPTRRFLSGQLKISERTVARRIKELTDAGLFKIKKWKSGKEWKFSYHITTVVNKEWLEEYGINYLKQLEQPYPDDMVEVIDEDSEGKYDMSSLDKLN